MREIVFYQGESIPVVISCSDMEIGYYDFVVLIYPQYDKDRVLKRSRVDFASESHEEETLYRCVIGHEETREMPVGEYTIEVMIPEEDGYRSVYQKPHAFVLKFSNFKNIKP